MKITTEWKQQLCFEATTEQGQKIVMDGNGNGTSPMQYVLAAVGGCSSIDVVMILQKGRHTVEACQCELTAERAHSIPAVFTKINAHYIIKGSKIPLSAVERACQLSMEKYCSVALMLNQAVEFSYSYELSE